MEKKEKSFDDFCLIYESNKIDPLALREIKGGEVTDICGNMRVGLPSTLMIVCKILYVGIQ
jgi:hypothetical protein